MSVKIKRLESNIIKEISYILSQEVKDNDIKFVTITDCHLTNDLSFAKIYFTILNDDKKEVTLKALKEASGFIRKELSKRVIIRHTPELEFVYDESIEYGNKIEKKLQEIKGDLHES